MRSSTCDLSFAVLAIVVAVLACGGEPMSLRERFAGSYSATTFTSTDDGSTTDHLAAGASVTLELTPQGTTAGRLFIPRAGEGGADVEADLAGTWRMGGVVVDLDHAADTFLRDMLLTAHEDRLVGDTSFAGTRIQLTLTKH